MDGVGAEVGQKMRSAIKAKLLELKCYVDDELPDYIMVMVANKRTKSQMHEDLGLFLSSKTSAFVEWLHIVLKKLKEVTVTNPEIYKKASKRKLEDVPDIKPKNNKWLEFKKSREVQLDNEQSQSESLTDSLPMDVNKLSEMRKIVVVNETRSSYDNFQDDFDIPLLSEVNKSSEEDLINIERKIKSVKSRLGLLVESDIEEELPEIKNEKDFKQNVHKTKLLELPVSPEERNDMADWDRDNESNKSDTEKSPPSEKRIERKYITFGAEEEELKSLNKTSILKRLGRRRSPMARDKSPNRYSREKDRKSNLEDRQSDRDRRNRKEFRSGKNARDSLREKELRDSSRERESPRERESRDSFRDKRDKNDSRKEGILSRLGVMSKVFLPPKPPEESDSEDDLKTRKVRSMVQVKPRVLPSDVQQPNKNLLLKAVAEAQRSVAQTPKVGVIPKVNKLKPSNWTLKKAKEFPSRKISFAGKSKLRDLILAQTNTKSRLRSSGNDKEEEYIPRPVKKITKKTPKYVPSSRPLDSKPTMLNKEPSVEKSSRVSRRFFLTVDGLEKIEIKNNETQAKESIKARLGNGPIKLQPNNEDSRQSNMESEQTENSAKLRRKIPSPIVFDHVTTTVKAKSNVPDKLPVVHPPFSLKNKERCKYWPGCRQGDKCEFVHPVNECESFPNCKFGDKCLYLHPSCKFGSSCSKRECPFGHAQRAMIGTRLITAAIPKQPCKFYPNCINLQCPFQHRKQCKFGRFCKNLSECEFLHPQFTVDKSSLTWRSSK